MLSLKPISVMCSPNTLGGKPFVSGSSSISFVLKCFRLMVSPRTVFHRIDLYFYRVGSIT
jgi:hypothetical protein